MAYNNLLLVNGCFLTPSFLHSYQLVYCCVVYVVHSWLVFGFIQCLHIECIILIYIIH